MKSSAPLESPQVKSTAGQLVQRGGERGDLGRMDGEWVEDAAAYFNTLRGRRDGCQDDGGATKEEIVAHPKLIETGFFGSYGKGHVVLHRQVVIEAQAELHDVELLMMASASISTRYSSPTKACTYSKVFAGRISPKCLP